MNTASAQIKVKVGDIIFSGNSGILIVVDVEIQERKTALFPGRREKETKVTCISTILNSTIFLTAELLLPVTGFGDDNIWMTALYAYTNVKEHQNVSRSNR